MEAGTQLTKNENRQRTIMKLQFILGVVFAMMLVVASSASARQSAEVLLESGLYKEEVKGDLDAAIKVYQRVLKDFPKDRPAAAKALLHIGLCYEKLGATEAQKAYRRLIKDFADQAETVAQARARLSKLKYVTDKGASAMSTRQVWAPALDTMGAPSPDGRYISYVNWNKGNLAVHDLDTGENRDLTDEGTWEGDSQFCDVSIWSPDSSQIAYCWITGYETDLRIVGLDGSKPRILHRDFKSGYLWPRAWSHNGKHILGVFCNKGTDAAKKLGHIDKIGVVSVEDGSLRILKFLGNHRSKYMDFSPDDRYLVFDLETEESSEIYDIHLMDFDGSGETGLVVHPANDGAPFWTPDGKHIVFTSDRSGSNALWILEVDGGKPKGDPTQVKEMGKEFRSMGFTVDGSFYYNTTIADLNVYVATLDFKAGKVLAGPTKISLLFDGSNMAPVWSPDGKYLAYGSQRSEERVLVIKNIVTGKERDVLPKTNVQLMQNQFHLAPQWSPDSDSILVTGVDGSLKIARGLYLIDAETGNVSPVVRHGSKKEDDKYTEPFWQVFSRDGKHIYYIGNSKLIMRHNLETHAESELYRSNPRIFRLALSPDGRQLAFVEGSSELQGCKVWTISTSGGQARELYTLKKVKRGTWMVGLLWTPDGTNLVLGKTDNLPDKRTEIWMIPVKGSEPSKFELPVKANHVSFHPDGRRIAFTGGELGGNSEIWAMENFLPKSSAGE